MNKILMMLTMGAMAAGCCLQKQTIRPGRCVKSPDGRNEIALSFDPLSFRVMRDGKLVVAPTPIGMKVDGRCLGGNVTPVETRISFAELEAHSGSATDEASPVYKKGRVDLLKGSATVDFGDWAVELAARDDGVAYRFVTKMPGEITVGCEKAGVTVPEAAATCWANRTGLFGAEETTCSTFRADELKTVPEVVRGRLGAHMIYLPFVYSTRGKTVAFTESDVFDYPILNLQSTDDRTGGVRFGSLLAGWPKKTNRAVDGEAFRHVEVSEGGRWVDVAEHEDYLVKTAGARTFPWRVFIVADEPSRLCESDAVWALARPAAEGADFSWVKPGKVAWDWWNCFDNQGPKGCNTKTYERFIDFAAKTGVEYVILDEGWSERLNIWKFHPDVDVPHLIDYANRKGVGIILWMAWAQIVGDEERVAGHFAKLGAKGFKVDFIDRGDAAAERFLWDFAAACAKHGMLIDYHGASRPTGLSRAYPNVVNYEGIHGNENMKWFDNSYDILANDVKAAYCRMTAGPLDYTPGAMLNHKADGSTYSPVKPGVKPEEATQEDLVFTPGTLGTRCRQMAMMALYEAPLQMLCDSPTNYEKNMESFSFMAKTPVVWDDTVGLGGCPDSYVALARQAKDGAWYAAAIANREGRDVTVDTAKFLKDGEWTAEIFRDAPESDEEPMKYVHERKTVKAGEKLALHLAPGGGFVIRFAK